MDFSLLKFDTFLNSKYEICYLFVDSFAWRA